ncbi:PPK2 family polyphosphate kinase [Corynebacterium choanae]|nr:PPK2 family polyphosphate kinase [Corynebacterium choanae]
MANFSVEDARATQVTPGFQLADIDPAATPNFSDSKKKLLHEFTEIDDELTDLQEMLYANARAGLPHTPRILLVLQGMDTSGKGGVIRHVMGTLDPQGVDLAAFGVPTEQERQHDFLWRIKKALPRAGRIGVFDRSHYEDVLVHRVHGLSPLPVIEQRYGQIVEFEQELVDSGTTIIKVMLHISPEFQAENLRERLERKDKYWKYNPGDIDERLHWEEYQQAYQIALERTSTASAPWYCVPSDNKPYARMVVKYLLLGALRDLQLQWPPADFDPAVELARLEASQQQLQQRLTQQQ